MTGIFAAGATGISRARENVPDDPTDLSGG